MSKLSTEIKYQLTAVERMLEQVLLLAPDNQELQEKITYAITAIADSWAYIREE